VSAQKHNKLNHDRLHKELDTLVEVGKALASRLTLEGIYQVAMEKISSLLKPTAWSLLIADEKTQDLRFEIVVSQVKAKLKGVTLPPGQGIAGYVAQHGTALLVPDVNQDERFCGEIDKNVGFETHSIVCVPLKTPLKVIGVIQLINALDQHQFSEQDLRILSTIADFTAIAIDNARLMEKVQELSITDELTELYNSRHFQTLIDYEIERAERLETELSLVFIDLDHFKEVNDTYGHLTGSRLLSEVGRIIHDNTRIVNHAARYGGDEFVILLPGAGNEAALGMIKNLQKVFQEADFRSNCGQPIEVTASIGVATYPTNAENKQELIRLADEAMYEVKKTTRNGVKTAYDLI